MAMTNEKVSAACGALAHSVRKSNNDWRLCPRTLRAVRSPNGIDGYNVSSMEHALFMCEEIPQLMEAGKREKAMRWLGYLQGALTAVGVLTLEEAKKMNMPDAPAELPVLTVRGARALARSFREHPAMTREELAGDMPTERLRQAAVRWEDARSVEDIEHAATCLAEALEEWATRTENGEATYEAADPSRAAVSEDHAGFTPELALYAAERLREAPSCSCGCNAEELPTPKLQRAYGAWFACEEPDAEQYLAEHFAELLEEWAAEKTAKVAPVAPRTRVHTTATCYVGLGRDIVAIDWGSSAPDMCQVRRDSQISIDELRQVLDVLDAHRKAL